MVDSLSDVPPTDLQTFAVLLRRLTSELSNVTHAFAHAQGLHPTDVQALIVILDGPAAGTSPTERQPVTPGMLREHLGLTSGAVSACLGRLEASGHIRRVREAADKRVVHLYYEPKARELARAFFAPLAQATDTARSQFTDEELQTVVRFLAAMNTQLTLLRQRPGQADTQN
ncbi:MarR family transcriptional regulator [Streptomyces sp. WAC 01529]|uniref:MarR family winged helix-turn-helix transcriptional regulator n=1 Tax=Streptomyces sp. WAC 01529 TaxID=2203205 RepID=UPI000F6BF7EE|nr:MarR family winged helix-turn-helix transcriptional regulator [Streptomyces sp. WAC 01529]AZM51596.1 MarR family transcriptional regulator [Streptomyces sp. WAC 01529]